MLNTQKINYLSFDQVKSCFGYIDNCYLRAYLNEIYDDLKDRDESKKLAGLHLFNFRQYFGYDYFFCERVFQIITKNPHETATRDEFIEGIVDIYSGDFIQAGTFLFKVLDLKGQNRINQEDVVLIFLYLPNESKKSVQDSLLTFKTIVAKLFDGREFLTLREFLNYSENINSSVFIELYCFFQLNRPFDSSSLYFYKSSKYFEEESVLSVSEQDNNLILPKENDRLEFSNFVLCTVDYSKLEITEEPVRKDFLYDDLPSERDSSFDSSSSNSGSKSIFVGRNTVDLVHNSLKSKRQKELKNGKINLKITDVIKKCVFDCSGFVLKYDGVRDLKAQTYIVLALNDLIFFQDEPSDDKVLYQTVVNIKNSALEKKDGISIGNITYYKFMLKAHNKYLEFYVTEKEEYLKWVDSIMTVLGKTSLGDIYNITSTLESRRKVDYFKGINKFSKEAVLIKAYKKKQLSVIEMGKILKENFLLNHLNHPSIVRLCDFFETELQLVQVFEYVEGKKIENMKINVNKFVFDFEKLVIILRKIADLLKYLEIFRITINNISSSSIILVQNETTNLFAIDIPIKLIVWRNAEILLTEPKVQPNIDAEIKYLAPEILQNNKIYFSSDYWSFGILLYRMTSHKFPFFDAIENEEAMLYDEELVKQINFPGATFSNLNTNFVEFLTHMLIFNPYNRVLRVDLLERKFM